MFSKYFDCYRKKAKKKIFKFKNVKSILKINKNKILIIKV